MAIVNNAHVSFSGEKTEIGVIGTLGTADVGGTALTLPFGVDATTGAAWSKEVGTPFTLAGGTDTSGVYHNFVTNSGGTLLTSSSGGASNPTSGTLNTLGTLGTLGLGTITGKDGAGVAISSGNNAILVGGTDSGGTVRFALVDNTGALKTSATLSSGTTVTVDHGTLNALASGTITGGTLQNLVTGTINALAAGTITGGTLQNLVSGTINALAAGTITGGTLQNLVSGTLNALATGTITGGTLQNLVSGTFNLGTVIKQSPAASAGSFTAAGSVVITGSQYDSASFDLQGTWIGTTFFEGQIGTSGWFAIPAVNSQNQVVGTQTIGNGDFFVSMAALDGVRARLTYSSGTQTYNARSSTFYNPVNYLTGGTLNGVGVVSNLTNGSVILQSGTLSTGTLQNLATGTINALAAGTITGGTLQNLVSGTINAGTVVMTTGTLNGGTLTNLNYGTVDIDPHPTPVKTILTNYGTTGTTGAAVFGTLVASVGNGTYAYIAGCSITGIAGTTEASIILGTFTQAAPAGGTNMLARVLAVPGGGIAKTFSPNFVSGTGGTICYWMAGAGTVYFDVFYYAST